jgi:hypothetical protein
MMSLQPNRSPPRLTVGWRIILVSIVITLSLLPLIGGYIAYRAWSNKPFDIATAANSYKIVEANKDATKNTASGLLSPPPLSPQEAAALNPQGLAACVLVAANTYHVPAAVLIGIMHVEGGSIGKESQPDANGNYTIGPMQISSQVLPQLARTWKIDIDTAHKWVRDDGCVNVHVAAWILRQKMNGSGSLYGGIAAFHPIVGKPDPTYADNVIKVMNEEGLVNHDVPLSSSSIGSRPTSSSKACQIKIGSIACENDPYSDVGIENAATVYEMYGFDSDKINQPYTEDFLQRYRCVIVKYHHNLKAFSSRKVATPNGWIDTSRVIADGLRITQTLPQRQFAGPVNVMMKRVVCMMPKRQAFTIY